MDHAVGGLEYTGANDLTNAGVSYNVFPMVFSLPSRG